MFSTKCVMKSCHRDTRRGRRYCQSSRPKFSKCNDRHGQTPGKKREGDSWISRRMPARWSHGGPSQRLCDENYTARQARSKWSTHKGSHSRTTAQKPTHKASPVHPVAPLVLRFCVKPQTSGRPSVHVRCSMSQFCRHLPNIWGNGEERMAGVGLKRSPLYMTNHGKLSKEWKVPKVRQRFDTFWDIKFFSNRLASF